MTDSDEIASDDELLAIADTVLTSDGYATSSASVGGFPTLLAEDEDNVLIVAALITVRDVLRIEPDISKALTNRLGSVELGPKKWDGYVVLLTAQPGQSDTTDDLFHLTYNLLQIRRIVRVGVSPTIAGVERALRALLRLPKAADSLGVDDPLSAMQSRLVADGLDPVAVDEAVTAFRTTYVPASRPTAEAASDGEPDDAEPGDDIDE
jgi:hypothetical protein